MAERRSLIRLTKDSYIALRGELCGVFCVDFTENWLRYNGTTLYVSAVGLLHWEGWTRFLQQFLWGCKFMDGVFTETNLNLQWIFC